MPPSTWRIGDPSNLRPSTVSGFFATEEGIARSVLQHEFGHHIHQQLGVKGDALIYKKPPLESELRKLMGDDWRLNVRPTEYSGTNEKEWFAESYSLISMGRADLVDQRIVALWSKISSGGF